MNGTHWVPWNYVGGGQISGCDGKQVAYLAGRLNDGNAGVAGHLMAAAPELCMALEALEAYYGGIVSEQSGYDERRGGLWATARAALAKARGESA
jgi:hypothetical protein